MKKLFVIGIVFFIALFNTFNIKNLISEKLYDLLPSQMAEAFLRKDEAKTQKIKSAVKENQLLDVPLINQMAEPHLKNGCEVTSLAMILNYYGKKVTKNELAGKIKTVPLNYPHNKKGNPNIGFVGDMANGPGLSVYNGPIFDLAKKYMGDRVINLTNRPFERILEKVSQGTPVWVITTINYKENVKFRKWDTQQGTIYITFSEHSVVITGYDKNFIYVNDPYGYKNRKVSRKDFFDAWSIMGKQAIAIES
ncbi:C39 family peptidase [Bacillus salipaludis]|uniref:C39 family peptidase n=1 Tax=Bacillus salipaludis TaxID=2547811 RepID=UPI003D193908